MRWICLFIPFIFVITGCDSNRSSVSATGPTTIQGLVSDDDGPVGRAEIVAVESSSNRVIAKGKLEQDGHYQITLPATPNYPILLKATVEKNGKVFQAVVTSNLVSEQDISPRTDLVVKSAELLGGLTPENIAKAAGAAINQRPTQSGKKTSTGFKGDLTKQYGGWH